MALTAETDTAHLTWNANWGSAEGRDGWETPEPAVVDFAAEARLAGADHALDLGCGVGRHAAALARLGLRVCAVDASPEGLTRTRKAAAGLPVETFEARMTALPFADAAFDVVVSWNVIYHGDPQVVRTTVGEIARVLRPGGRLLVTMLTKRNRACGIGREIAPDTWVDDAARDDKMHPHFYCDAAGFVALFDDFHLLSLREDDFGKAGHAHWLATLERRAIADVAHEGGGRSTAPR